MNVELTLLLPQKADRFALKLELVPLPTGFSAEDSSPDTDRGCPGSTEERISPIEW